MKKFLLMSSVLVLFLMPVSYAGQLPSAGTFGLGVNGGIMIPASGDITSDSSFSDYFKAGPDFGLHFTYIIAPQFTVEAGFDYAFMKLKDEAREDPALEPYFSVPYLYVDGKWNMGPFLNPEGSSVNPYLLVGPGLYFWKITEDGAGGDAMVLGNNEEFKKSSFGLQFGAGSEFAVAEKISLFAEGKYHLIFAEDTEKFGDAFGNLSGISVTGGLTFYLK